MTMTPHATSPDLLLRILDQLPDGVILLDRDGLVVDANRAALEQAGVDRSDWVGRPLEELSPSLENVCELPGCSPDFVGTSREPAEEADRADTLPEGATRVQARVDATGRMRYFQLAVHPVQDEAGRRTHTLVVRRDVTLRTALERRLQQAEKLAAIGELSTYIAHEIRNPLFAIAGFANSLLRSAQMADKDREKVSIILAESNRLDKVLKTLFDFTRPTQGQNAEVDAPALARQTLALMNLGLESQGVTVRLEADPDLPLCRADPERIKQCLINLLRNALEAMPAGGALTVRCRRLRDMVCLEVQDTGTGIDPKILNQVFNPFFSTKDKGAGLGLAMTKKILDDLGGSVELESVLGQGTTVRLILPPVEGEAAPRFTGSQDKESA